MREKGTGPTRLPVALAFLQIIGRPSVPVRLFIEYERNSRTGTERSEERRVATLHTEVSRVGVSETWRVACSHALSVSSTSQTPPGALAHSNTASFPQEPCSFPLDIHSPFLLGLSLLTGPCSQRMCQVASARTTCVQIRDFLVSASSGCLLHTHCPSRYCWHNL